MGYVAVSTTFLYVLQHTVPLAIRLARQPRLLETTVWCVASRLSYLWQISGSWLKSEGRFATRRESKEALFMILPWFAVVVFAPWSKKLKRWELKLRSVIQLHDHRRMFPKNWNRKKWRRDNLKNLHGNDEDCCKKIKIFSLPLITRLTTNLR